MRQSVRLHRSIHESEVSFPISCKYEWVYKEGMFGMTTRRLFRAIGRLHKVHKVYMMGVVDKASANFKIERKLVYQKMSLTIKPSDGASSNPSTATRKPSHKCTRGHGRAFTTTQDPAS